MIYDVESLAAKFNGRTETVDQSSPGGLDWPVDTDVEVMPQHWRDLAELAANTLGFAWMGVAEIWDAGDRIDDVVVRPGQDGRTVVVEMRGMLMDKDAETQHRLLVRAVLRRRDA